MRRQVCKGREALMGNLFMDPWFSFTVLELSPEGTEFKACALSPRRPVTVSVELLAMFGEDRVVNTN